ncbi:MAG: DNA internalization-related competence protein ComEC/Rec2 [Gammaproteobacteria bacterium]|jgi:competence protein ComEC
MQIFILSFLVGVCGFLAATHVPNLFLLLTGLLVAVVIYLRFKNKITIVMLGIICGFCWVMLYAQVQLAHRLPAAQEGKVLSVVGKVISLPQTKQNFTSFVFQTSKRRLKLNWYNSQKTIHPGEVWHLHVKLKRPHGFMNPGGFDYEAYLFVKGISAIGYVVNDSTNKLVADAWYSQLFNRLRQLLRSKIQYLFIDQSLMGFVLALVVGDRTSVTPSQWQILRHTGTNHLIAIAGLHVGLVAGFIFFLTSFLWRRIPWLTLRFSSQQAAAVFSLVAALFYSLLAGFSLQTERAFIMLLFLLGALLFKRRVVPWYSWSLALLTILILNPLNVINISFWMSFMTVAAIIYSTAGRVGQNKIWRKYGKIQLVIMVAVIPLSLLVFHEASLVSIIANVIAVPWFGFIIMPLCFAGAITLCINQYLGFIFLWLALKNLQGLWMILQFLANLPHVILHFSMPHLWLFGFMLIAVILILAPRKFPAKYLSIIFLLPLLTYKFPVPKNNQVWFTLLDVGQGLASIVRTRHHILIYDTGPKFSEGFDAGSAVILPYLQYYGINKVDLLMVSHGDNDHIGGMQSILQNVKVDKILTSVPQKIGHSAHYCYRGQHWNWDGVKFKVLSPLKSEKYSGNDSSCVLRITAGKQSILLTGDIQKLVEDRLLKSKNNLAATILVAPHHGSRTSSSVKFVRAVHPKMVLYPTGYRNRFRFPSVIVRRRYQQAGAKDYNTAYTGAVLCKLNGSDLLPQLYRERHLHLWF